MNLFQNSEKRLWREDVPLRGKYSRNQGEERTSFDLGEQQHAMAFASWTVSQLEREWNESAIEENKLFSVDLEVAIGGNIRE